MKNVERAQFKNDYQFQEAKKVERKKDIGRRSGRRGTANWGKWSEAN